MYSQNVTEWKTPRDFDKEPELWGKKSLKPSPARVNTLGDRWI